MKNRTMINRMMTGSAVALMALGMLACTATSGAPSPTPGGTSDVPTSTPPAATTPPAPTPTPDPTNPVGTGESKSVQIDNAAGGAVELSDGTKLEIPAGALPDGVDTITVTSSSDPAPSDYKSASPLFIFGPEGTIFKAPVQVSFVVAAPPGVSTSELTVLWSRTRGNGYDIVPSSFTAAPGGKWRVTAEVMHFSTGFCGKKFTVDPRPDTDPYQE